MFKSKVIVQFNNNHRIIANGVPFARIQRSIKQLFQGFLQLSLGKLYQIKHSSK